MAKKVKTRPTLFCRDCQHAYDFHDKNYKGDYILCRCPFFKWSKFLNKDYCEKFKNKNV